ncbi:MAG: hypothetical protein Q4A31_03215 [Corynebacterium sp.]|uniref:hypothetical protein n=1 Tax=Corynebacterium sp. TaxID=1720 RepID=UPI0026DD12BE|nr:hypothetical protein [Corynebacterium sp.]MDO4760917.1 hypothetical protein [Corynebacterium sp.]
MVSTAPTREDFEQVDQQLVALGWKEATYSNAGELPLGTKKFSAQVCSLLFSGAEIPEDFLNPNHDFRAIYATRAGASPKRFHTLTYEGPPEVLCAAVKERGTKFALTCMNTRESRFDSLFCCTFPEGPLVAVIMAICDPEFHCPIPRKADYLVDWAAMVADLVVKIDTIRWAARHKYLHVLSPELLESRLEEHLNTAIEENISLVGPLGFVLVHRALNNRFDRDRLIAMIIAEMEIVPRRRDRQQMVTLLMETLGLSDADLLAHQTQLGPLLSTGEPSVIEAIGTRLIPLVKDADLVDVALGALYTKTNKALKQVLHALAQRHTPSPEIVEEFAPALVPLLDSTDSHVLQYARELMQAWGIEAASTSDKPEAQMWQETPPLWEVPRYDAGSVSVESVMEALGRLPKENFYSDVDVEIFLSRYFALVHYDPDMAQRAIQGAPYGARQWLFPNYFNGDMDTYMWLYGEKYIVAGRDATVVMLAAQMPSILSEPSYIDLRITVDDFVQRLEKYHQCGAPVYEPDFVLALLRLDLSGIDQRGVQKRLSEFTMPVHTWQGEALEQNAGQIAAAYIAHPYAEPALEPHFGRWFPMALQAPPALKHLPRRFTRSAWLDETIDPATVPSWGDGAWTLLRRESSSKGPTLGRIAAQAARSQRPFGPGLAINMLNIQRPTTAGELEGVYEALMHSWERGLVRPGVADVRYLGWKDDLTSCRGIAQTWGQLAREGLLSVIWPLYDALLAQAFIRKTTPAGVSDVAASMARLAPHVLAAVLAGRAPKSALLAQGARAWAERAGTSKVIEAAQEIVAVLGECDASAEQLTSVAQGNKSLSSEEFQALWCLPESAPGVVLDTTSVRILRGETPLVAHQIWTEFQLRDYPGRSFLLVEPSRLQDWIFRDRCTIIERTETPLRISHAPRRSMYWNGEKFVIEDYDPNYRSKKRPSRLPDVAIVAMFAGLQNTHNDEYGSARYAVKKLLGSMLVDPDSTHSAMQVLLNHTDLFSPGKVIGFVTNNPASLPSLWPLITDSLSFAAKQEKNPHWLNRILDAALEHTGLLRYGIEHGFIHPEDFAALDSIAGQAKASAARKKARELHAILNLA